MRRAAPITPRGQQARVAFCTLVLLATAAPAPAQKPAQKPAAGPAAAPVSAVDRIRQTGTIRLGHFNVDVRPFSFKDGSGNLTGYSVGVCQQVVEGLKSGLGVSSLKVEWVPVAVEDRFRAAGSGDVDLFCGADGQTVARRKQASFSAPVFPGGVGAMVRADARTRLKEILAGQASTRPNWRAESSQLIQAQVFGVLSGTTAETWVPKRLNDFRLTAKVVPVPDFDTGIKMLMERRLNVLFAPRSLLLEARTQSSSGKDLLVVDRRFTYEPDALLLPRGDDDFRLAVDQALGRLYETGALTTLYTKWFGAPDVNTLDFFRWTALPE